MAFLIGTDEAGYGPNLGPLVVSASVWQASRELLFGDLYDALQGVVEPTMANESSSPCVVIADSKRLYKSRGSLAALENGVLAALGSLDQLPRTSTQLWNGLSSDSFLALSQQEWYGGFEIQVPIDSSRRSIEAAVNRLRQASDRGVRLVSLRSVVVFPDRFNRVVDDLGTKAALLSQVTLDLVADLVRQLPTELARVVCDKHGGRNNYAALLQPRFEDRLVRVVKEGRAESSYDVETAGRTIRIEFRAKGESFLPSALASMTSKYLRELAMIAFNRFWQSQVADLEPTAGYPADAIRFRQQIEPARARLGIPDERLWRSR